MRERIYSIINDEESDNRHAKAYDWIMTIAILLSLYPLCFKEGYEPFVRLEWATTALFIVDYLARWLCADFASDEGALAFVRYPFTPLAIIDFISIVPTFAHVSQVLRLSRLVRLLRLMRAAKLIHHSRSLQLVMRVLNRERDALMAVLVLSLAYVFLSALAIFNVEPDTFESFFDALYWSVISLSTIGYGDICPVTPAGQLISMVSAMMGIAVVALPSGIITAGFVEELRQQ